MNAPFTAMPPPEATPEAAEAELRRHGISRIATEHFEYGGYRYTNLKDALAQARRRPEDGS